MTLVSSVDYFESDDDTKGQINTDILRKLFLKWQRDKREKQAIFTQRSNLVLISSVDYFESDDDTKGQINTDILRKLFLKWQRDKREKQAIFTGLLIPR